MRSVTGVIVGKFLTNVPSGITRSVVDMTTEPGHVQEYADAFQKTFNQNTDTLLRYANDWLRADHRTIVVALRFTDRHENEALRFLIAQGDEAAGDWTAARIVGPERFYKMDQTIDRHVSADWYLSRNATAELQTFIQQYARPTKEPPERYIDKIAAKYSNSRNSDLIDGLVNGATRS